MYERATARPLSGKKCRPFRVASAATVSMWRVRAVDGDLAPRTRHDLGRTVSSVELILPFDIHSAGDTAGLEWSERPARHGASLAHDEIAGEPQPASASAIARTSAARPSRSTGSP